MAVAHFSSLLARFHLVVSDYSAHRRYDAQAPANGGFGVDTDAKRALRYRNLAREIGTRANSATSDQTRQMFLKLAQDYDKMAKSIEDAEKNRAG